MELKHRNFFGEQGLTQTSANYIANKAKEYISSICDRYLHFDFFSTSISLIGSDAKTLVSTGMSESEVKDLKKVCLDVAKAKSLIAYLREAIKERDKIIRDVKTMTFDHAEELISPVREQYVTEEEIIDSWSAEKLARYYYLQSIAATFGGMVHPDGPYHKARERYLRLEEHEASINGVNTVIKTNTRTVHPATVDGEFFEMQEQQRNAQAEFNGLRHEIELALEKDKIEKDNKYASAMKEYYSLSSKLNSQDEVERNRLLEEALALKIVIPANLKGIYDKISDKTSLA